MRNGFTRLPSSASSAASGSSCSSVSRTLFHLGLGVGALTAVVVGYVVATVVTFLGNRHWAFKHRQGKGLSHETLMFVMLNLVGLGIQEAVVATVHYGLHMTDPLSYNVANIVGIGLGTLFRLWSYRKWVFLEVNEKPGRGRPDRAAHGLPGGGESGPGLLPRRARRGSALRRQPAVAGGGRAASGTRGPAAGERVGGDLPAAVHRLTSPGQGRTVLVLDALG